mmetsp:Transcript_87724/g.246468  ORF Transcript_87724/g.246468 Transcript_87724/m.246468 type:complete len:242 (-) Transcript_87724:332-1057(-)
MAEAASRAAKTCLGERLPACHQLRPSSWGGLTPSRPRPGSRLWFWMVVRRGLDSALCGKDELKISAAPRILLGNRSETGPGPGLPSSHSFIAAPIAERIWPDAKCLRLRSEAFCASGIGPSPHCASFCAKTRLATSVLMSMITLASLQALSSLRDFCSIGSVGVCENHGVDKTTALESVFLLPSRDDFPSCCGSQSPTGVAPVDGAVDGSPWHSRLYSNRWRRSESGDALTTRPPRRGVER